MKRIILLAATLSLAFGAHAGGDGAPCGVAFGKPSRAGNPPASSGLLVERAGEQILVHAQSEVDAEPETIWATLSDYDHLAGFIPDMVSSRTLSRTGARAVVEQTGTAGIGLFRQSFSVLLAVREQAPASISLMGVGGDFKRFEACYHIVRLGPRHARIVYNATLVPDLPVPPLVGLPVVRSMIGNQFEALVQEVQRRAGNA